MERNPAPQTRRQHAAWTRNSTRRIVCETAGCPAIGVRWGRFRVPQRSVLHLGRAVRHVRRTLLPIRERGGILPNEEQLVFITPELDKKEEKTSLRARRRDAFQTGKEAAAVILRDRCNVNQDVIAVKVNRNEVNPFYLATFLNTRFGRAEMRHGFGQVQPICPSRCSVTDDTHYL